MRIDDVRMGTADVTQAAAFYRDVLDLPVAVAGPRATVTVGRSTVTLDERLPIEESNHLAFTIPSNRFADAKAWLQPRVELMSWGGGESELRLGEPWNSESLYFLGPDRVILELITRARLENPSEEPFSGAQMLCVSEVGLGAPDVGQAFASARRTFGVETFAGESRHFTTAGDQDGLLIFVTTGRPWFPTADMGARSGGVHVTISGVSPGAVTSEAGWSVTALA